MLITENEIKEMAADLLFCSTTNIRLRHRVHLEGEALKQIDGVVYYVPAFNNALKSDDTREIKNLKFQLNGKGVWFQDNLPFFCTSSAELIPQFHYVECVKF